MPEKRGFEESSLGGWYKKTFHPDQIRFRQSRVIETKNGALAKRVVRYISPFGQNSMGLEVPYKSLDDALNAEKVWVDDVASMAGGGKAKFSVGDNALFWSENYKMDVEVQIVKVNEREHRPDVGDYEVAVTRQSPRGKKFGIFRKGQKMFVMWSNENLKPVNKMEGGGEATDEVSAVVAKYGWRAEKLPTGNYKLYNRNDKMVVNVLITGDKYKLTGAGDHRLMTGRGQLIKSLETLLTQFFYAMPNEEFARQQAYKSKTLAGGGVLVGKSDINGREGIDAVQPDGTPIKLGGGEIVMSEKASRDNCEKLSAMNVKAGGNAIPCDVQKVANTDRASGKMPKNEYFGDKIRNSFSYGGGFGYSNHRNLISDSGYEWKIGMKEVYDAYKENKTIPYVRVADHPDIFSQYPQLKSAPIRFVNSDYSDGELIQNGSIYEIVIGLNFKYYEEHGREQFELRGKDAYRNKEAILLHETQHYIQARAGRLGPGYDELRKQVVQEWGFGAGIGETDERVVAEAFKRYYWHAGEQEARITVYLWLLSKGINIYGGELSGGGISAIEKPYYLLTREEVISERDRLEAIGAENFTFEESYRMRDLARYSVAKFGVLLSKLEK